MHIICMNCISILFILRFVYIYIIYYNVYIFIYIYMYIRQTNMQSIDLKFLGHSTVGVISRLKCYFPG